MKKIFTLALLFFLAVTSFCGYLFLNQIITRGEQQIAEGEAKLAKGQKMLAAGQAKLASGKNEMAKMRKMNKQTHSAPFIGMAIISLPVSAAAYIGANQEIDEGNKLVLQGEERVKRGEERLKAGETKLNEGKMRLQLARSIRTVCAISSILFILLLIFLGLRWSRS